MNQDDEIKKSIIRTIGELITDPAKELSAAVTDQIKYYRWRSLLRISQRASELRKLRGNSDRVVPIKVLIPLLEEGSKEDEDGEMIDIWARLLAGSDSKANSFDLMCIELLGKLTSLEAKIIQSIGEMSGQQAAFNAIKFKLGEDFAEPSGIIEMVDGYPALTEKATNSLKDVIEYLSSDNKKYTWRKISVNSKHENMTYEYESTDYEESIVALHHFGLMETKSSAIFAKKSINAQIEIEMDNMTVITALINSSRRESKILLMAVEWYGLTETGRLLWRKINS